jgi:diacylglycerol kinase (ATP)
MAFPRIVIIYNPNSTGPSRALAEELAAALLNIDHRYLIVKSSTTPVVPGAIPIELAPTQRAGHAVELAEAAARRYDRPLIVSSSGDGGYHEVVGGVMRATAAGHPAVTAVLPAGNANDHHRTLARDQPLADRIRAGRTTRIDLLRADFHSPTGPTTTSYAHSYLGLGLTPVVAAELNRHTLNAFRELIIMVKTFAGLRPVTIQTGGRTLTLDSLILSNINQMAKALTVSQTGDPQDGQFEITAFPAGSKLALLGRLVRAAIGGLRAGRRASRYEFTVTKPTPIQLDGEVSDLATGTRVTVTAAPSALETIL